jgi:hypothetical protein
MSNVGKIFVDTTVERMYAVGKKGFIDLTTGEFIHYDSAFSEETFDHPAFQVVEITRVG